MILPRLPPHSLFLTALSYLCVLLTRPCFSPAFCVRLQTTRGVAWETKTTAHEAGNRAGILENIQGSGRIHLTHKRVDAWISEKKMQDAALENMWWNICCVTAWKEVRKGGERGVSQRTQALLDNRECRSN